jgi:hypothetical protein
MTANELWDNVLVKFDSVYTNGAQGAAPGFDDVRASIILTYCQWKYANTILFKETNAKQQSFDEVEVRRKGLSNLIARGNGVISANQSNTQPNGVFYELPDDMWYTVLEQVTTNIPDCRYFPNTIYTRIPVRPIPYEWVNNLNSSFHRPYIEGGYEGLVIRFDYGKINNKNIHELVTDGTFNITQYHLTYLKTPTNIVVDRDIPSNQVDPELNESTHESIADLAVKVLTGIIAGNVSIDSLKMDLIH